MMLGYLRRRSDPLILSVGTVNVKFEYERLISVKFSLLIAPEYALNEQITTSSDLYSLGCIIYAVHDKVRFRLTYSNVQPSPRSLT